MSFSRSRLLLVAMVLMIASVPMASLASHSWGGYHWARTSNPFTLKVHDNLNSTWEPYLSTADTDWDKSNVLDLNVIWQSPISGVKRCTSAAGVIEICNSTYGQTGWLGIAGISASGGHITKGYTKLNDTYFNTAQYNTPAWRRMVTCQEIGHDFGLAHQDETFANANLGSCMDYTDDPDGGAGGASSNDPNNEHPNQHDFDQIASIYAHLDTTTTISAVFDTMAKMASRPQTIQELLADAGQWGSPVSYDGAGRPNVFALPVGTNAKGELEVEITHIFWAPIDPFAGPGRSVPDHGDEH